MPAIEKGASSFLMIAIVMMSCMIPGPRAHAADPSIDQALAEINRVGETINNALRIGEMRAAQATGNAERAEHLLTTRNINATEAADLRAAATNFRNIARDIRANLAAGRNDMSVVDIARGAAAEARAAEMAVGQAERNVAIRVADLARATASGVRAAIDLATRNLANARAALVPLRNEASRLFGNLMDALRDVRALVMSWRAAIATLVASLWALQTSFTTMVRVMMARIAALLAGTGITVGGVITAAATAGLAITGVLEACLVATWRANTARTSWEAACNVLLICNRQIANMGRTTCNMTRVNQTENDARVFANATASTANTLCALVPGTPTLANMPACN